MERNKRNSPRRSLGRKSLTMFVGAALSSLMLAFAPAALGQTPDPVERAQVLRYMNGTYLAYVNSGTERINRDSERGLTALQAALTDKTSLDPNAEIVSIDLDSDTLLPFKFLYWPVTDDDPVLSKRAQEKVQAFIDDGNVIMFDVRSTKPNLLEVVSRVLGDVNLGPLTTMPGDHSLTYTFYRTDGLAGTFNIDPIYIQTPNTSRSEDVTSVIIGRRDWAKAWAGRSIAPNSEGFKAALRAGMHAVLYAYTGNYQKAKFEMRETLDNVKR